MRYAVIAAGWLWGLAALPQVTDAALGFGWFFLLPLTGGVIGLVWIGYSAAMPRVFRDPYMRWLWPSVPVIGLGALLLCFTHYDLAVRVWLCEAELREHAEAARRNPNAPPAFGRRVGLFEVRYTSADEKQVKLHTASNFMDSAGIVYRPDGMPPEYCRRYQHLYGPWWWFWEDF